MLKRPLKMLFLLYLLNQLTLINYYKLHLLVPTFFICPFYTSILTPIDYFIYSKVPTHTF